jgi:hypothetical protein
MPNNSEDIARSRNRVTHHNHDGIINHVPYLKKKKKTHQLFEQS